MTEPTTQTPEPTGQKRPKNPTYHVFEAEDDQNYRHLTHERAVRASNRKEAIKEAVKADEQANPEMEDAKGERTFLVIAEKEFRTFTPTISNKPVWSF